jgi:CelD/BcsL family acetyltransferase involved in cellulose biosynthesis
MNGAVHQLARQKRTRRLVRASATADAQHAEIVADEAGIAALQEDWDSLYARARAPKLSQSFEWAWCVWRRIAKPRGERPCLVVVRGRDRVRLIWPLVLARRNLLWPVAAPLGTTEYHDVLVEPGPEAADLTRLAWRTVQQASGAAIIRVERVRSGSVLAGVLAGTRREIDRKHRRLRERGDLAFELVQEPERQRQVILWMLRCKKAWLERGRRRSLWLGTPEYDQFCTALPQDIKTFGRVSPFVLTLDGEVVAADLNAITNRTVEGITCAYDDRFRDYSPGSILNKHILQWGYQHRLAIDMRMGDERYKEFFANQAEICGHYIFVNSRWGHVHELCRELWRDATGAAAE